MPPPFNFTPSHLHPQLKTVGSVSVTRVTVANGYRWLVTFDGCKVTDHHPLSILRLRLSFLSCPILISHLIFTARFNSHLTSPLSPPPPPLTLCF